MPEIGALQAGPRTTSTVCPMTPGALRVEDSLSRRQLTGVGAGERPGLRSQQLRGHEQCGAEKAKRDSHHSRGRCSENGDCPFLRTDGCSPLAFTAFLGDVGENRVVDDT